MLALWKEWGVDAILIEAYEAGKLIGGLSAGAICWFAQGATGGVPDRITAVSGLGLVDGSAMTHYQNPDRRDGYHALIQAGDIGPGYGLEDNTALKFIDGELAEAVTTQAESGVVRLEPGEFEPIARSLETRRYPSC